MKLLIEIWKELNNETIWDKMSKPKVAHLYFKPQIITVKGPRK